jgi:hypothetical protein
MLPSSLLNRRIWLFSPGKTLSQKETDFSGSLHSWRAEFLSDQEKPGKRGFEVFFPDFSAATGAKRSVRRGGRPGNFCRRT